jgi:hypothetical protein
MIVAMNSQKPKIVTTVKIKGKFEMERLIFSRCSLFYYAIPCYVLEMFVCANFLATLAEI